jgi:large repetitive protein
METKTSCSYGLTGRLPALFALILLVVMGASPVMAAAPLPAANHLFITMANDAGAKFDLDGAKYGGPSNTYYILADGGGLNQLHITDDLNAQYGKVMTSTSQSGTFYLTTTGGQGYNDDIILLVSVQDPIPDDFSVHIKSSGYAWTTPGDTSTATYVTGAVDETFTKSDFIYGAQTWKPGPVKESPAKTMPLYSGQDISDPSTNSYLMFVDLNAGNKNAGSLPIDTGAVKVEYSFTNLDTSAAFNVYSWRGPNKDGQGISWTNRLIGTGSSGYFVTGIPRPIAAPEFPTMALPATLIVGMLGAVFCIRRTKEN